MKQIDGNFLRKENWTLGKHSGPFESVNTTNFKDKGSAHKPESKEEIAQIKTRVGGDHVDYKTGPQDGGTLRSYFQSMAKMDL